MKFRLLILILFFSGTAHSEADEKQNTDTQDPKKGDEIWLEEKISPTTTWIENLVKPLTVWMERKINAPEPEIQNQRDSQHTGRENTLTPVNRDSEQTVDVASLIDEEQVAVLAKRHIPGDVLYIKLISKTSRYRVKLISTLGEIHIIYLNAVSGEIVVPDDNKDVQASSQVGTEQNKVASPVPTLDREHEQEKP
ncbi:MAG: hypothetical protein KTR16_02535 [Acidiferrobacterales bacterium]|nr:hypothetical protein [Acidiferrobacterales bacterium]